MCHLGDNMFAHVATFETSVYRTSRGFNIPKRICRELGVRSRDSVYLIVKTPSGQELFKGRKTLKSDTEIYGQDIASVLEPGRSIVVEVYDPQLSEAATEAQNFDLQERNSGFQSNPKIRRAVEKYAMSKAQQALEEEGFKDFEPTADFKCYDYTCKKDGELFYVEVKGTQGSGKSIILTKNEVEHANYYQQNSIAVVVYGIQVSRVGRTYRSSGGKVRIHRPWDLDSGTLEAIQYRWSTRV